MSKPRALLLAMIATLTTTLGPIASVAQADPNELVETFVATGTWNVTGCTQASCTFTGRSTACAEVEAADSIVNSSCTVALNGVLAPFLISSNACELATSGTLGNVAANFVDGSEGTVYNRTGVIAGAAVVGQGLVITSATTDLFDGVMAAAYPPTSCPPTPLGATFAVTMTVSAIHP